MKGPEKYKEADEPLLTWFVNMRANNKELNNSTILQAAERIALRLGIEGGALNESWVQRWRERHGIKYVRPHGESADCPDFSEWLVAIQPILVKYHLRDIYNMDETALFWRMSSGKTFVGPQEEKIRGRKANKSRVTLLVGCSMDGEKCHSSVLALLPNQDGPWFKEGEQQLLWTMLRPRRVG